METSGQLDASKVAFTVRGLEKYTGFSKGEAVPYKLVRVNMGGYFSVANRGFTCPYHGLYVFSVTLTTRRDLIDGVQLQKNGDLQFIIIAYAENNSSVVGSGSTSMVMECFENDFVRVVSPQSGEFSCCASVQVFSGFLLYKL